MMDAMSVVTQLRDLASEPQNREAIAKDEGCLPGLVLFLDHKDPEVVFATLQTLRYLAESHQNINSMKNELGMMVSLETLMEKNGLGSEITDLAKEVYEVLSAPERRETLRTPVQPIRRNKPQFFINSSNKKAKTVTLLIQGLDGTDRRGVCEEALLKVKGVISFTFQMAMKRITVRVRADLPTESLASAIASTKVLSAQQVVRNESGEEGLADKEFKVVDPASKSPRSQSDSECMETGPIHGGPNLQPTAPKASGANIPMPNTTAHTQRLLESFPEILVPLSTTGTHIEENNHVPDYLPEDESPEKETDRAISRTNAKQDASGSWLSSAASFLTKTFYW